MVLKKEIKQNTDKVKINFLEQVTQRTTEKIRRTTEKKFKFFGDYIVLDDHSELTKKIIGCAIEVHRQLGPGLLESSYEECLCYELTLNGLYNGRQVPVPVVYKEVKLDIGYRIDILVEKEIVLELKSVECLAPIHEAQILTYLKFSKKRIGLLMNFNSLKLIDQLKRFVK